MAGLPKQYLALLAPAWEGIRSDALVLDINIGLGRRLQLAWTAHWLSLAWRAQQLQHPVPRHATPSLVAGFWRSGTTLLHELLLLDPQWSCLTTHQCMNPATMLRPPPRAGRAAVRPMDAMRIDASTPQECEFASLMLGSPSFYRVLLLPESWERQMRFLDPARYDEAERAQWLGDLRAVMTLAGAKDPRPLLLKSPTHAFRLDLMHAAFPGAKTVFIDRDPLSVLRSNLKLWRSLFALYALSPWDDARLLDRVLNVYALYVRRVIAALPAWSAEDFVAIRYEQLVADPVACIAGLYARLGWTFSAAFAQRLLDEWQQRRSFVAGTPAIDPADEVRIESFARSPYQALQAALREHGMALDR